MRHIQPVEAVEPTRMVMTITPQSAADASAVPDREGPWNHAAALARAEGDVELLCDMARIFLSDCPRLVSNVRTAISKTAPLELEHAAHELKGCLGNFAAHGAFHAAERLELLGRAGQMGESVQAARLLEAELDRLTPVMRSLIDGAAP